MLQHCSTAVLLVVWGIYKVFLQCLLDMLTCQSSEPTCEMCVVGENCRFSAQFTLVFGRFAGHFRPFLGHFDPFLSPFSAAMRTSAWPLTPPPPPHLSTWGRPPGADVLYGRPLTAPSTWSRPLKMAAGPKSRKSDAVIGQINGYQSIVLVTQKL